MLKTHGRYDYSAITKRPDYSWPGGKRREREREGGADQGTGE